jgi:hypothetical protein
MRFGFSDQDVRSVNQLLTSLHEALCGFSDLSSLRSYLIRQQMAAEEMRANILGQVLTTLRAQIRPATAHEVSGEFREAEADAASWTLGDSVPPAVDKHQGALFGRQDLRPLAVRVRKVTFGRLDIVRESNRPRTSGAVHVHGQVPFSW